MSRMIMNINFPKQAFGTVRYPKMAGLPAQAWAAALCLFLCLTARADQSVTLAWSASPDPTVVGYKVYVGPLSGDYTNSYDAGSNTTYTVTGLKEGNTNYLTVTAYNADRVESAPPGEVAYIVPGLLVATPPAAMGNPLQMRFPVAPGHWYEVQASTDMQTWSTIYQTPTATANVWSTFQDPQSAAFQKRFYRLVLH